MLPYLTLAPEVSAHLWFLVCTGTAFKPRFLPNSSRSVVLYPSQSLVTFSEDRFIRSAVAIATDVDINARARELILANNHR